MKEVEHNPELAREVYNAYRELSSKVSYRTWIHDYVAPLAKMLEEEGIMKLLLPGQRKPASQRHVTLNFKAPAWMTKTIEDLAEALGMSKSELIRTAILFYLIMHYAIADCASNSNSKTDG